MGGWVEVTRPHLDRHNDLLQFYIRKEGEQYKLTDDGYILGDLVSSGCSLEGTKREALVQTTLAGFGVKEENQSLVLKATAQDFPLKKITLFKPC